ncbi:MAG: serine/threonine protein kinase [Lachnospiraceae bacterium]|nr:serine/threonine protein kinase [Lachnospiraceae bacterium]MCI8882249.1 serine/threonine protein kinase [Lachnospiraceae bacterium]
MFGQTTLIDMKDLVPLNNEGKNSSVFSFVDPQLGAEFILKKISKSTINDMEGLFNESKILYEVRHPNIMEIQYASYDDDSIYIVMPRCKNGSVQSILDKKNLTVRETLKYSLEFLTGLQYVHAHGLIHYDIKPTNILVNDNGKAILTDFGLAKYMDGEGLATQQFTYISELPPEKYRSGKTNLKCDIYQAGITIYRMCNGNGIWERQLKQAGNGLVGLILAGEFPDRKLYLPHIPLPLRKVINKCIEVDPDKRYNSVLEIINALSMIGSNLDWRYSKNAGTECWEKTSNAGNHKEVIELSKKGDTYVIAGKRINIGTKKVTNVSKLAYSDTDKDKAVKKLASFLKG